MRVKKLVVLAIGSSVIFVGAAMIVLPGPAFIVIPAGLAILATEFVWAKRLLCRMKNKVTSYTGKKETLNCSDEPDDVESSDSPSDIESVLPQK